MSKKNKKSIFEDRRVTLIAALLLALLFWIVVAGFIMPADERKLGNVRIDYTRGEETYQEKGLQMVGEPTELYADVLVKGDGNQLGPLSNTSVSVYPDYSAVGPGTQEVPLRARVVDTSQTFYIYEWTVRGSGYSLGGAIKDTVTLTFEEVESRSFEITPKAEGITAAEGFFRDALSVNPRTVDIRGPRTRVEQIAQVVAEVPGTEEREESLKVQGVAIRLLDERGDELDPDELGLTLSVEAVDVDVTILEIRTIGLTAGFTGLPTFFDTEWFDERVMLSVEEMQVVGASAAFDNLENPFPVAYFDVSQLGMRWESDPVSIDLTGYSGLRIYDQLRYVTVSFDTTGLMEKTFEVPARNIRVVNGPVSADISPLADSMSVRLIGPEDQINSILAENITVQVDAFGITTGGQQSIPARVLVPVANQSFAIGNYSIICDVSVSEA